MADDRSIDRRDCAKLLTAAAVGALVALDGCESTRREAQATHRNDDVPVDKMEYRTHPKTKDKISLLGYGCMRLPRRPKAAAVGEEDEIDQEAVNASVDYALAHGVNYFDTSPRYCKGKSERAMGRALSRHPRSKYFLATKMSNQTRHSRDESLAIYQQSMRELKVDYFDYYLVHAVGTMPVYKERYLDNGVLDFMLKERESGRVRNLGWSFHGDRGFFDYMMSCGVDWDFVQIQASYFDWKNAIGSSNVEAKYLYEVLLEKRIPAIIMEPLLGGRLARPHYRAQDLLKRADPTASMASWAFRFAGTLPNVLTVLSGMTYMEHLQDNIRCYSPLKPLSERDVSLLEHAAQLMLQHQNINCTGCQYCMPCPYGLDIPGIFAHYNRCLNEGNFPDNTQDPGYQRARRAFLLGMDRSVPALRQADHCIGCALCKPNCPQSINIPKEMVAIERFVDQLRRSG